MEEYEELAASFPVVLFDGEEEIDFGNVMVHPSIGFKRFQTIISQKIGVPPSQISTSLVRRRRARSSPEIRRKEPINESSDFTAIARETGCFILVLLKRSRRTRTRRRGGVAPFADESEQEKAVMIPPEKIILKRYPPFVPGFELPPRRAFFPAVIGLRARNYNDQMQNPRQYKQQYLSPTAEPYVPRETDAPSLDLPCDDEMFGWHRPATPPVVRTTKSVVCEECLGAKEEERSLGFHWCVYDAVTVDFRSAVGPIQRPPKKLVEALA